MEVHLCIICLQGCQRPLEHFDQAVTVPGLREMGSLVGAMLQEWEVAMHNAAVAGAAQMQQSSGSAQGQAPVQQTPVAASEGSGKDKLEDLHVVQDLVQDIKEKPQAK